MQTEIIIIVYFLFIVGIGVYSSFRIKKPDDYYVAGKKAGFVEVSGSLMATILGGSAILGTIELSQKTGWAAIWFLFSAALGLFALVPVSKYVRRYGNYTLPELLGTFYGKKAETIASLIIPLAWLGIVAAQIIASAKILSSFDFLTYQQAAVIAAVVFTVYTLLGGQHSILKTDALQAVLIIAGLTVLLVRTIPAADKIIYAPLKISALFNNSFGLVDLLVLILTYSVTFVVGPDIYSRVFCARNEKTAARSVISVAALLIPISFGLTYLGVISAGSETGIVSFAEYLLPPWAYGLFLAALLSAVMSSADTTLLTSSMILSELFTGSLKHEKSLRLTRFLIVGMGMASLIVALYITSIIQALLLALSFFSGAFVVPTLAGLLQINVNKKNVALAMIFGGLVALSGNLVNEFSHSLAGNLLIAFAYIVNGFLLFWQRNLTPAEQSSNIKNIAK